MRYLLCLAAFLSLTWGCGYRFSETSDGSAFPPDVRRIYIELISNATYEPFIENRVTEALVSEFARSGRFVLTEDRSSADAVLSGRITSYTSRAVSFDRDDKIAEYRSEMRVSALVRRNDDGRVLWKGEGAWTEEYPASSDRMRQEDNESVAIGIVSDRIAEQIYYHVMSGF